MTLTIENGTLLDTLRMEIVGERHVTIEGDRIVDVDSSPPTVRADRVIDARGRFLLPGFVDAHVHHVVTTMDFVRLQRLSSVERALAMGRLAEATVRRGFTRVRDTGGDTAGLADPERALELVVRGGRVVVEC